MDLSICIQGTSLEFDAQNLILRIFSPKGSHVLS